MEHFVISCGCTYSKRACRLVSRRTGVSPFSQKLFISLGENSTFLGNIRLCYYILALKRKYRQPIRFMTKV